LPLGELQLWFRERFNIAPTEEVPVIVLKNGRLQSGEFSWGIRPGWSKRPLINAKSETIHQRPTFRESFRERRCLIPADGFYEWRKPDKAQFWFRRPNQEMFCFGGLWEDSIALNRKATCAIITVAASSVVQPVHDRMPLILAPSQYDDWLSHSDKAEAILRTGSQVELTAEIIAPPSRPSPRQPDLPIF